MNSAGESGQTLCAFISHREEDKGIADVLRRTIEDWSTSRIGVCQFSHPGTALPTGGNLSEEIRKALAKSCLVLLVHVVNDESAAYCMYEVGLATDPENPNATRVVVVQCRDDVPAPLMDLIRIQITRDDIHHFAEDFHRREGFFPDRPAFAPGITDELLDKRANELYESLRSAVPVGGRKAEVHGPMVSARGVLGSDGAGAKKMGVRSPAHPHSKGRMLFEGRFFRERGINGSGNTR